MKCPACEDGAALVPSIGRGDMDLERGVFPNVRIAAALVSPNGHTRIRR
jgi:hypothetical protein